MVDKYMNKFLDFAMSIHQESKISIDSNSTLLQNEVQRLDNENKNLYVQYHAIGGEVEQLKIENVALKDRCKNVTSTKMDNQVKLYKLANESLKENYELLESESKQLKLENTTLRESIKARTKTERQLWASLNACRAANAALRQKSDTQAAEQNFGWKRSFSDVSGDENQSSTTAPLITRVRATATRMLS